MSELLGTLLGYLLSLLLSWAVLLANQPAPYVTTDRTEYPYSFTDPAKPPYQQTIDGARLFVHDSRELWEHRHNKGCRRPTDSYGAMWGDCDDWAVMIAGYLQEYFGYDTFIVMFRLNGVNHACPFVASASGVVDQKSCVDLLASSCRRGGVDYYPIEEVVCPVWVWTNPGGPLGPIYEWADLAGNLYI